MGRRYPSDKNHSSPILKSEFCSISEESVSAQYFGFRNVSTPGVKRSGIDTMEEPSERKIICKSISWTGCSCKLHGPRSSGFNLCAAKGNSKTMPSSAELKRVRRYLEKLPSCSNVYRWHAAPIRIETINEWRMHFARNPSRHSLVSDDTFGSTVSSRS